MVFGDVGQAAIRVLLAVVLINVLVQSIAIRTGAARWRRWSRRVMAAQFIVAAVASASLIYLLVTENFWYAYVSEYTGAGLPLIYRIAAFWGGNAGSLLFWSLVLTLYGMVTAYSRHEDSERMLPIVSLILTVITLFYTLVVNCLASPFVRLSAPVPGSGLNPLLQNPGMTVHPVNVYLGFIGFSVPFAYAMAGLILGKTDATWLKVTRRWTLISWLFLSIGIVYGAHWSYEELGWGGYWAWDPVENASLLPWLTGTAFLHSAIVQEKRGMLKVWNVVLVTLTFLLTLLGTFLTRSGVLWSIHAFANAPLGNYFLAFLAIVLVFSVTVIVLRRHTLKADRKFEAVVSKETGFMLNNILFLGSAFAVLWGTIFPLVSEAVSGRKMMVDSPFYNAVNLPLAVCILLLMGIGPMVAWRRSAVKNIVPVILYPLVLAVALGLATAGVLRYVYHHSSVLGTLALIAALFVAFTVVTEYYLSIRTRMALTQDGPVKSFLTLLSRNRRRYGGYIVHLAVAVIAIGIAGSGAYHADKQQSLAQGQSADIAGYHLTFDGMGVTNGVDSRRMYAELAVSRGGTTLGVIRPSATFYTSGQAPTTNVALYSTPLRDLYVVMLGTSGGNQAVFDIHVNPLVQLIWFGGYLFIVGTLVSLWPESFRARQVIHANLQDVRATAFEQLAELEYDHRMKKLDATEYERSKAALSEEIHQAEQRASVIRQALEREVELEALRRLQSHQGMGERPL